LGSPMSDRDLGICFSPPAFSLTSAACCASARRCCGLGGRLFTLDIAASAQLTQRVSAGAPSPKNLPTVSSKWRRPPSPPGMPSPSCTLRAACLARSRLEGVPVPLPSNLYLENPSTHLALIAALCTELHDWASLADYLSTFLAAKLGAPTSASMLMTHGLKFFTTSGNPEFVTRQVEYCGRT